LRRRKVDLLTRYISVKGFPVYGEASKTIPDQQFDFPRSDYYRESSFARATALSLTPHERPELTNPTPVSYMSEILAAVWEDHVHVIGAIAWSFVDNWGK